MRSLKALVLLASLSIPGVACTQAAHPIPGNQGEFKTADLKQKTSAGQVKQRLANPTRTIRTLWV